ncbi:MAG TPA: DUF4296 domain-containing protein [Flavobacteriaceae bacterium]|nr:DUF4296 domain-containing protein [Flavobacteriaceae bacterium]
MKLFFKYLLLIILVSSCQNIQKAPKPENLIPESKMIAILEDLAKIDAAANLNQKAFNEKGLNATAYIYEKYGVDSAQFAQNSNYYLQDLETSKRMYEEVRRSLEEQKVKLDSILKIQDSIRAAEKKASLKDNAKNAKEARISNAQKFFSKLEDSLN